MKFLALAFFILPLSLWATDFTVVEIESSLDRNFNGIVRGITVFQDILVDDHGAHNERGLIKITGDFSPLQLIKEIYQSNQITAYWKTGGRATILDRGYINDGTRNPRVPKELQKVIDLYNRQIMGLANGSSYKLLIFSVDHHQKIGWLIYNTRVNEALIASSTL